MDNYKSTRQVALKAESRIVPKQKGIKGNIRIRRVDPYGFIQIQFDNGGTLPEHLRGNYTNVDQAVAALTPYLAKLGLEQSAILRETEDPEVFEEL